MGQPVVVAELTSDQGRLAVGEFHDSIWELGDHVHVLWDRVVILSEDLICSAHEATVVGDLIFDLHEVLCQRPLVLFHLEEPLRDLWVEGSIIVRPNGIS